jgi:hypothetical protein
MLSFTNVPGKRSTDSALMTIAPRLAVLAKTQEVEFRQDWTRRIGLGFEIPSEKAQLDRPKIEVEEIAELAVTA